MTLSLTAKRTRTSKLNGGSQAVTGMPSTKKWTSSASISFNFGLFTQTIQLLYQTGVKKCPSVHTV